MKLTPTPELRKEICAFIRQGGFPHVAAQAAGVKPDLFNLWMERGANPKQQTKYRHFFNDVTQAVAQARLLAEIDVRKQNPQVWLSRGPGRESANNPGWTRETKPIVFKDARKVNILATPEWISLWTRMLQAIQNFPEARAALSAAVDMSSPQQLPPPQQ